MEKLFSKNGIKFKDVGETSLALRENRVSFGTPPLISKLAAEFTRVLSKTKLIFSNLIVPASKANSIFESLIY